MYAWAEIYVCLGLLHMQVICNVHDSQAYSTLCDTRPYPDKQVIKHEYVGHVQKHVGKYVRELKKDKNAERRRQYTSCVNRHLTNTNINKLIKYTVLWERYTV